MIRQKILYLAVLASGAAGCTESEIGSARLYRVDSTHVAVRRHNGPEAIFSATGEVSLDGKKLTLNPAQKDLAIRYFSNAGTVEDDGFATGMAGASTALTALSSVVSNLANGEPDKIGPAVEAKAAKVEEHAAKLCRDLRELAATQDALAVSLPEFKPYALIEERDASRCEYHG